MSRDDREFVRGVEDCSLPREEFRHRDHLRLAWLYLQEAPYEDALRRMAQSIRRYAASHGASQKYHHTVTLAWMRLVAAARAARSEPSFDAFLEHHPALLDKTTLRRFYSDARIGSEPARERWVEPDLEPLPR
jgi:hypothetical protein